MAGRVGDRTRRQLMRAWQDHFHIMMDEEERIEDITQREAWWIVAENTGRYALRRSSIAERCHRAGY